MCSTREEKTAYAALQGDLSNVKLNQDARVKPFFMDLVNLGLKATYEKYGPCDPLKDGPPPAPTPTTTLTIHPNSKSVVIVGAGMAGMAAALEFLKEDINVTLLEKDSRVGGRLKSYRSAEFSNNGVVEAGGMRIPGHMPEDPNQDHSGNVHYLTDWYINDLCHITTTPFKNKEPNAYVVLFRKNTQTAEGYERVTRAQWEEQEAALSQEYYPGWDHGRSDARLPDEPPFHTEGSRLPTYPNISDTCKAHYNIKGVSSIWTATMLQVKQQLVDIANTDGVDTMWERFTIMFGDQEGYDFLRTPNPEILKDNPDAVKDWMKHRIRPWSEIAIQGYTDTSYMGPRLEYSLIETLRDEFGPWWGDWMYTIGTGMDDLPNALYQELVKGTKTLGDGKTNFEMVMGADVYGVDVITEADCQDFSEEHKDEAPAKGSAGDHDNMNELYCSFPIPADLAKIRKITITMESKDQGWASDTGYPYSWVEVGVGDSAGNEIDSDRRGVICRNAIGVDEWGTHVSPKGAFSNIYAQLQPGATILIFLRSQYPGWRCYANSCKLDLEYIPITFMSGYFQRGDDRHVLRLNKIDFNPPLKIEDGKIVDGNGAFTGHGTAEDAIGKENKFNIANGQYIGREVVFGLQFEEQKDDSDACKGRQSCINMLKSGDELTTSSSSLIFKGVIPDDQSTLSGQWFESGSLGGKFSGDFEITMGTSVKVSARVPETTYLPRRNIPVTQKVPLASESQQDFYGQKLIMTAPLTIFRQMQVTPPLSVQKQQAINSAFYTPSTKVMIEYAKKFWIEEGITGGISKTTDVVGQIVYPTNSRPSEDGNEVVPPTEEEINSPGILVSYTWQQNAVILGGQTPEERATTVRRCIERMHPGSDKDGKVVHQGAEHYFLGNVVSADGDRKPHYHSEIWHNDQYAQGAILHWTAHQYSNYYKAIMDPEYSAIWVAGEGASWANAWIQGALQSGLRAAYMIYAQLQAEQKSLGLLMKIA